MLAYYIDAHASTNKRINHSQSKNPIITLKVSIIPLSLSLSFFLSFSLSFFLSLLFLLLALRSQSAKGRSQGISFREKRSACVAQYTCMRDQLVSPVCVHHRPRLSASLLFSLSIFSPPYTHMSRRQQNEHKKVMVRYW